MIYNGLSCFESHILLKCVCNSIFLRSSETNCIKIVFAWTFNKSITSVYHKYENNFLLVTSVGMQFRIFILNGKLSVKNRAASQNIVFFNNITITIILSYFHALYLND